MTGQALEEDIYDRSRLARRADLLARNLPLRLPEGRRVGGAGDLACMPPPF
jgi:hypothetical protein